MRNIDDVLLNLKPVRSAERASNTAFSENTRRRTAYSRQRIELGARNFKIL
jgi:hypothetical protein